MADLLGQQFGNYRLTHLLGKRDFGNIYLGEHISGNALAAVKVLRILNRSSPEKDFLAKAQTIAHLEHPHILHIIDFGVKDDNDLFLITPYTPHGMLRQRHPKGTTLQLATIVGYVKQITSGLQYAHNAKVIHSGIRPEEMLLGYNNDILLDFSNATLDKIWYEMWREIEESPPQSLYPNYWEYGISPLPDESLCPAYDQYSLGIVVYEWIAGYPPFTGSFVERVTQHIPPPLREKVPALSPSVEGVILTALARDPQHRFANVHSFAYALEQASLPGRATKATALRGQQLGNYRLVRLLGQGGFAEVYLAEHIYLKTPAAVKVLHPQLTSDELNSFLTEARTLFNLEHPHIMRVLDFGEENRIPFLVMGYAFNGTLRQRHPKGVKLPLETIVSYVKQIAAGLQHAHDEGFIHRDIKPENMLLGRHNEILLSDFGIAVVAHSTDSRKTLDVIGTVTYMAPEQLQGKPVLGSDQYSLGIVVYEWITGHPPFTGSFVEIATQHTLVSPPPLREKVPALSSPVEQVVLKTLAKDPKQRFSSVQEFAQALEQASLPRQTPFLTYRGHSNDHVEAIAWSPDSLSIASVGERSGVQVWDVSTGRTILTYTSHSLHFHTAAWSPDGTRIASGGSGGTVQVWDAKTGIHHFTYHGHSHEVGSAIGVKTVAWSPDGTRIASGGFGGTVQVWDAATGNHLLTYTGYSDSVLAVTWSPDGTRIASASRRDVQVWNSTTGAPIFTYKGHSDPVFAMAWSPDGTRIASASLTKTVQVWDAKTGMHRFTFQGGAFNITWSPDGTCIASASHTVEVWDATNGAHICTFSDQSRRIQVVAWSPDGKYIASGSGYVSSRIPGIQIWQALS